ncbi:MAG: DUF1552 domain-containing protein, partial [Rubripirellula sp.]
MMKSHRLSRRRMLHGLGVTMALPWMESINSFGNEIAGNEHKGGNESKDRQDIAPVRMAVLFSGCGYHSKEWWARGTGSEMELGKVLKPIEAFRDRMVFINGLYNAEALKGNIHSSQTGNLLSGAPL